MKILIGVLLLFSFLQTTVLPINLVLLVLVLRSFIVYEPANFYLGFGFGLLTSHLNTTPLGLQGLIFLAAVVVGRGISRLPISNNILIVVPLVFVVSLLDSGVNALSTGSSLQVFPVFLQTILAIPVYLVLRFWEERFVVRQELKLKI
ncbi:MAG: hypothetical protein Q7R49_02850 [Candidatus Daviesbacteria bacterium]|nr:hypothetical protein [Candidatus Daviesbacteria bacterium]